MPFSKNRDFIHKPVQLSRSFEGLPLNDSAIIYARKAYEDIKKNATPSDISLIAPILGSALINIFVAFRICEKTISDRINPGYT